MQTDKYKSEVQTLKNFFELNCISNHKNQKKYYKQLIYNNKKIDVELELCEECLKLINYSFDKLRECPHHPKPRCRACPSPCYEKNEWKKMAKLMRYSGIKLGILKIKRLFTISKKIKKPVH